MEADAARLTLQSLSHNPFDNGGRYELHHLLLLLSAASLAPYPVGPSQRPLYTSITATDSPPFITRCLSELERRERQDEEIPQFFVGVEYDQDTLFTFTYHPEEQRIVYYLWEALGRSPSETRVSVCIDYTVLC